MKKNTPPRWDCRQAKAEIALEAGGDAVDPAAAELLAAHLSDCGECRRYRRSMAASLEMLEAYAVQSRLPTPQRSVWPGVAARLPSSVRPSVAARFNVWVPTAAMAVACAAMLFVTVVQIERAIPLGPAVAPQLHMVLGRDQERDIFPKLPADRLRLMKEPAATNMMPVKFDRMHRDDASPADDRNW